MSGPSVTVVVPARGRVPWLTEAIESLADGGVPFALVVVEDGTRHQDESALRRLHPAAELVVVPPVGRSAARNLGVEGARTPVVAFLDADDVSLPGRLARELEALEAAPGAALVFGRAEKIDENSCVLEDKTAEERRRFEALLARGPTYESLLLDCPIYTSATMVRRDAFLAAGGYRPALDAFEDLDLYLRLARAGGLIACAGEAVARHRLHPGNTSVDDLFAGSAALARLHLADDPPGARARRLLIERELDALWGLGAFSAVRRRAAAALLRDPLLLGRRRFLRRLAGSVLPAAARESARERRR